MNVCVPEYSRMEPARMKKDKDTDEVGQRGVSMERSKAGTNKRSPDGLYYANRNTILLLLKEVGNARLGESD